jgi:hypothetical protein
MMTTHTGLFLPSQPEKGLRNLIIILATFFLVSCSHTTSMHTNGTADSQKKPETAQKARGAEEQPGDIRVIDGVEYIYGKNVRYGVNPYEPLYAWVRRDQYTAGWDVSDRLGASTKELKELKELEDRIARLEAELSGKGTRQPASSAQSVAKPSVSDETGRKWTSYWKTDNGVEWFYDKDSLLQPRKGSIQMWRKRVFPSGSAQKEIVTRDEISCREAQWRTLELRVTYWDGATRTSDKATSWVNVYPRGPEEDLMDEHCK